MTKAKTPIVGFVQLNLRKRPKPGFNWKSEPQTLAQVTTIELIAKVLGWTVVEWRTGLRRQGNTSPRSQAALLDAFKTARALGTHVIVADIFDLVRSMPQEAAQEALNKLELHGVPIFSAIHGKTLDTIPAGLRAANLLYRGTGQLAGSNRIKQGLRKSRQRGRTIKRTPSRRAIVFGNMAASTKADKFAEHVQPYIEEIRASMPEKKRNSMSAIMRALNERDVPAPRGGPWTDKQVRRTLDRLAKLVSRK